MQDNVQNLAGAVIPVFPLPDAVFFPETVLPLHVFEPRYREMVRDASASDGRIAIALLRPGFEQDYKGSPAFHRIGTVGRIEDLSPLPDGRFLLNLVGLERVALIEMPSGKPYRIVRVEPRPEHEFDESDSTVQQAKIELLTAHGHLLREISGEGGRGLAVNEQLPFLPAVNGSCASLPSPSEQRQDLLELDDPLERQTRVLALINEVLQRVLQLKASQASESELN